MFQQSGKIKEGATEKYNDKYGFWWTAHNAMLAFLKTWERQMKYKEVVQDFLMPMMKQRKFYSPEHGWIYCEEMTGMKLPEGVHADPHIGFEGDSLLHRMLPSVFYQMKGELAMVIQGEKQLMMKVIWKALKKLTRRVLRRP